MVVRLSYLMSMTEISLIGTVFHILSPFYFFIPLGFFLIMKSLSSEDIKVSIEN